MGRGCHDFEEDDSAEDDGTSNRMTAQIAGREHWPRSASPGRGVYSRPLILGPENLDRIERGQLRGLPQTGCRWRASVFWPLDRRVIVPPPPCPARPAAPRTWTR